MNTRKKVVFVTVFALFLGVTSLYYYQENKRKIYLTQQKYLEWMRPVTKHLPESTEVIAVYDPVNQRAKGQHVVIIMRSKSTLVMLDKTENSIEVSGSWREPSVNYKFIQEYVPNIDLGVAISSEGSLNNAFFLQNRENKTEWNIAFVETTNGFYTWCYVTRTAQIK